MNKKLPSMERINLGREVSNGIAGAVYFVMHLNAHYKRCDEILKWLIKHQLTGYTLLVWLKLEHQGSQLRAISLALKYIDHEKKPKLILLNKDFIA